MIESLTLHLGFPVSVDPSHSPRHHKSLLSKSSSSSSSSSRSSKSRRNNTRQSQQESKTTTSSAAAAASSSCHALEWMEDLSGYFSRMVSCGGGAPFSSHEDHQDLFDEDAASSIVVSPMPSTRACTSSHKLSSSFPALEPAHSIHSSSNSSSRVAPRAAVVVSPPTKPVSAQPPVFCMTDKTPTVRNSKSSRSCSNKYSSSSDNDNDDDTQLTTATTASVHSVLSWNTTPTRDTSLESQCSSSLLEGLEFVAPPPPPLVTRRHGKNKLGSRHPKTMTAINCAIAPLPMRRCTSDPAQADQMNARHVKASVFPHLRKPGQSWDNERVMRKPSCDDDEDYLYTLVPSDKQTAHSFNNQNNRMNGTHPTRAAPEAVNGPSAPTGHLHTHQHPPHAHAIYSTCKTCI